VKGLRISSVTIANAANAILLSSPAHSSSQSIVESEATSPNTASTPK
jgi:hypothetical protein